MHDAHKLVPTASRLNQVARIGSRNFVMDTALVAAIQANQLGDRVASMGERSADLLDALVFLVSGI